jgi:tetratricopeptide (TPR) repeat protein
MSVEQLLQKAKSYKKKGKVTEAKILYEKILQSFPQNTRALEGLESLKKFNNKDSKKNPPQEIINQLVKLLNANQFSHVYKQSKSLLLEYPNTFFLWNILGISAVQNGTLDEALIAFNKSISLEPNYVETYNNLGNVLREKKMLEESIKAFKKAIALKPDYADAYSNMSATFRDQGKLDYAIDACKKAIIFKPNNALAYNNMGSILKDQIKLNEAVKAYQKAIVFKPDYADAYSNMGVAFKDLGKLDNALEAYKKAISLRPNFASYHNNIGNTLKDLGNLGEAIQAYEKAISLKPDFAEAHKNLSFAYLNKGLLKKGFEEYEWRWETLEFLSQQRNFRQPMWDGKQHLDDKRILIWCEQGIGDTLMWSSYLSLIGSISKHCVLECQEKLIPLLKRSFPNIQIKCEDKSIDLERDDIDFHLPMGNIYKNFIKEISKNNKVKSYLIPDPVRVKFWKERLKSLGNGPFIGISWKSRNMSIRRLPNYCQISELYPILNIPEVTFINLQYIDFEYDLKKLKEDLGVIVHNFDDLDHYDDIDDVAALCSALDVIVSTKTTVPIISAGVGTSTKLANWKQSPWNNILLNPKGPSINIYERNTLETWDKTFNLISQDILKFKKNGVYNG